MTGFASNYFMQNRSKFLLILLLIALILLQSVAIQQRSFWEDETVTATLGPLDFGTITRARAADNHPPLYWLSAALWGRVFGYTEWGLKSLSLLWLVLAALVLYQLTDTLYGQRAAVVSVAVFVFSPYVLTYGHNARYYAMSAALSLFLVWMAKRYLDDARWMDLFFYFAAGAALLYTLYMGATILIAVNIWYFVSALRQRIPPKEVFGWLSANVLIVISFLPWLSVFINAAGRNLNQSPLAGNLVVELFIRFGYLGYAYLNGEFLSPANPLVWLMIGLFLLANLFAAGKTIKSSWLPMSVILVCLSLSVIVNLVAVYPQSAWQNLSNRTFFIYPFFVIWLAGVLTSLRPKSVYLSLGILFLVYTVGIINYFNNSQMIKPLLAVPWRTIMQKIQVQKYDDSVVMCSGGDVACPYYLKRYNLDGSDSWSRERILNQLPEDLWWIQINLGAPNINANQSDSFIDQLEQSYQQITIDNYAPQDRTIRSIKTDFFHQVDYAYRVSIYHFSSSLEP